MNNWRRQYKEQCNETKDPVENFYLHIEQMTELPGTVTEINYAVDLLRYVCFVCLSLSFYFPTADILDIRSLNW